MNDSAYRIPKAELHLHIEGTIEPELAFVLAERNAIRWPYASPDKLRLRYEFSNLQSFLDVYYEVSSVLRTEQDFADITEAYLARARAQGVRHAEIFFDPQAHASRNVPIATVIEGLHSATKSSVETYGISASLIMCFMRDHSAESAMETLMSALPHQAKFIGVGLDSAELGNPPSKFEKVFEVARQNGLHLVAHAGEEAPPDYVWDALRALKVERVDHGIRALEDPELVAYLRENQIPLTVCPLSNVKLKCYSTLAQHALPEMLRQGLLVSVNSDDPAFFGGYIADNYAAVAQTLSLTEQDLRQLAENSFRSSFLPEKAKEGYIHEVRTWSAEDR